jgi:hypothetical protein
MSLSGRRLFYKEVWLFLRLAGEVDANRVQGTARSCSITVIKI